MIADYSVVCRWSVLFVELSYERDVITSSLFERIHLSLRKARISVQVALISRLDEAWSDSIHSDSYCTKLDCRGLSQHLKTCLGHAVGNQPRLRTGALVAANVDNATAAAFLELLEEKLGQNKRRSQVNVEQVIVVLGERRLGVACKDIA